MMVENDGGVLERRPNSVVMLNPAKLYTPPWAGAGTAVAAAQLRHSVYPLRLIDKLREDTI